MKTFKVLGSVLDHSVTVLLNAYLPTCNTDNLQCIGYSISTRIVFWIHSIAHRSLILPIDLTVTICARNSNFLLLRKATTSLCSASVTVY